MVTKPGEGHAGQGHKVRECDGRDLLSGMLPGSHMLQQGGSTQTCTPPLSWANKFNLKNAFRFEVFHWKRERQRTFDSSKQLKELPLLYLKAQENPSSPLLLEAFKIGSITIWIHISCWCKWVRLHWASEGLSLVHTDSFLNAANNKQLIFLCFNCRVWHPEVLQGSPRWSINPVWSVSPPHTWLVFTFAYLIYLSSCPHYLLLSRISRLNLKPIEVKCKTSLNATDYGSGL